MNKAKAYRELQKRQGRLIRKVWSDGSSAVQSYESAAFKQNYSSRPSEHNMLKSESIQVSLMVVVNIWFIIL